MKKNIGIYLVLLASMISWLLLNNIGKIWGFLVVVFRIMLPFVYGGIFAYLLNPLNKLIKSKFKNQKLGKLVSISTCVAVLIGTFLILVVLILPGFIQSISQIISSTSNYINVISTWLHSEQYNEYLVAASDWLIKWINENLLPSLQSLSVTSMGFVGNVVNALISLVNTAKNLLIGVFVMIYVLLDYDSLKKNTMILMRKVFKEKAEKLFDRIALINRVFSSFLRGKLLDSLIIGILCFFATSIFNIPYALLVSVIVGITNIIPFFGPFIGAIPSALLVLVNVPSKCIVFIIIILILQQIDGNILGPKILGDTTGLSPFWVLFSIILCGGLFGIVGMIIGVPLFSVLSTLISEWINDDQLA